MIDKLIMTNFILLLAICLGGFLGFYKGIVETILRSYVIVNILAFMIFIVISIWIGG